MKRPLIRGVGPVLHLATAAQVVLIRVLRVVPTQIMLLEHGSLLEGDDPEHVRRHHHRRQQVMPLDQGVPGGLQTCTVQTRCTQLDVAVATGSPELVASVPPGVVGALNIRHGKRLVPRLGVMPDGSCRLQMGQDLVLMVLQRSEVLLVQHTLGRPVTQPVAVVPQDDTAKPEPFDQVLNIHRKSPDTLATVNDMLATGATRRRRRRRTP